MKPFTYIGEKISIQATFCRSILNLFAKTERSRKDIVERNVDQASVEEIV